MYLKYMHPSLKLTVCAWRVRRVVEHTVQKARGLSNTGVECVCAVRKTNRPFTTMAPNSDLRQLYCSGSQLPELYKCSMQTECNPPNDSMTVLTAHCCTPLPKRYGGLVKHVPDALDASDVWHVEGLAVDCREGAPSRAIVESEHKPWRKV